jgi:UDP-N-acetylmuramoyl-L-alanyl-D-glutamate--2,6-diaminopimelate ligase
MEIMQKEPFMVIVDFAHNTDSLEQSLKAVKTFLKKDGRLISVFGSAGLRDVEKRYTMGKVSGELADITIVTSEDPRTESLQEINTEIIRGAKDGGARLVKRFKNTEEYNKFMDDSKSRVVSKELMEEVGLEEKKEDERIVYAFDEENVNSRFDAIQFAVRIARVGDVIITEGKGHEKSLCFGTVEYPFTDQEAVNRALEKLR